MSRQTELKVGLVGCGKHGEVLARAALDTGAIRIVACADPDTKAVDRLANIVGGASAFASADRLLDESSLDAVIIATPHFMHVEHCLAAIAAGLPVFAEKPLGRDGREAGEIASAATCYGRPFMVGYALRYAPVRTMMRDMLQQGAVGDVQAILAGKGGGRLKGWPADPKAGGGNLRFVGSHLVDQILWLLGDDPVEVFAHLLYRDDVGSDETAAFQIRFRSGPVALCLVSQGIGSAFDYLEFLGREGRVRSEWSPNPAWNVLRVGGKGLEGYAESRDIPVTGDPWHPLFVAELNDFAKAVAEDRDPPIIAADALRVWQVLDAVVESGKSGAPVKLST